MQFRKKPVVIEAWRVPTSPGLTDSVPPTWLIGALLRHEVITHPAGQISIPTPEGVMVANRGDWIIRDVKGELYPCKNDIFEATYEALT